MRIAQAPAEGAGAGGEPTMPAPAVDVRKLVREARAAIGDAQARSHRYRAWELLLDREDGRIRATSPYETAALAELHLAHEHDPGRPAILHHLAIAHHARA